MSERDKFITMGESPGGLGPGEDPLAEYHNMVDAMRPEVDKGLADLFSIA